MRSFREGEDASFHHPIMVVGSNGRVGWVRMSFVKSLRSSREWQQGPAEVLIERLPGAAVTKPCLGTRSAVGRIAYKPLKAPGALMLPPMSVVSGAAGTPRMAHSAPSPPEDPPEPKAGLYLTQKGRRVSSCPRPIGVISNSWNYLRHRVRYAVVPPEVVSRRKVSAHQITYGFSVRPADRRVN